MRRLSLLALALGLVMTTLLALTGQADAAPAARSCDPCPRTVSDDLNLRGGPGTEYPVMLVIPAGSEVLTSGPVVNNFIQTTYNNRTGWAHNGYIEPVGGPVPGPGPVIGHALTTVDLNLRSGSDFNQSVIRVLAKGSLVDITATVRNGFRYVSHQGQYGWVYDSYLALPTDPGQPAGYVTVTVDLNLREEPHMDGYIILVMQAGETANWTDEVVNGFRKIIYHGMTGWAYDSYLRT